MCQGKEHCNLATEVTLSPTSSHSAGFFPSHSMGLRYKTPGRLRIPSGATARIVPEMRFCIPAVAAPFAAEHAAADSSSDRGIQKGAEAPPTPQTPPTCPRPLWLRGLPLALRRVRRTPRGARGPERRPRSPPRAFSAHQPAAWERVAGAGRWPPRPSDPTGEAPRPSAARGRHGGAEEPRAGAGAASRPRLRWAPGPRSGQPGTRSPGWRSLWRRGARDRRSEGCGEYGGVVRGTGCSIGAHLCRELRPRPRPGGQGWCGSRGGERPA